MLWRFYVYLGAEPWFPPRREVLFKLNGAKLSEPAAASKWRRGAAAVCKLLSPGDNLNAYFASYIILLLPAKLSRSVGERLRERFAL